MSKWVKKEQVLSKWVKKKGQGLSKWVKKKRTRFVKVGKERAGFVKLSG